MIKGKFRPWLAFYMITLTFGFIFLITLSETAQKASTNDTILGFLLATGLASILAFYFGSSETPPADQTIADKENDDGKTV